MVSVGYSKFDDCVLNLLPQLGVDLNLFQDINGNSLVSLAVAAKDEARLQKLLSLKLNPNVKDQQGNTVLYTVVEQKQNVFVRLLLEAKADPNFVNTVDKCTPLFAAVKNNDPAYFWLLLRFGVQVNVNVQDANGRTCLYLAVLNQLREMTNLLLLAKAKPNLASDQGFTPVIVAASRNDVEALERLLVHGANSNLKIQLGASALMYAIKTDTWIV